MLNKDDMMSYFTDKQNNLYQMIGYCPYPTVIMLNLLTKQTEHIVPDCLNAENYIKIDVEALEKYNNCKNILEKIKGKLDDFDYSYSENKDIANEIETLINEVLND